MQKELKALKGTIERVEEGVEIRMRENEERMEAMMGQVMGMMKIFMCEGAVGGVSSASGKGLIVEEKPKVSDNGEGSDSEIEDKGISHSKEQQKCHRKNEKKGESNVKRGKKKGQDEKYGLDEIDELLMDISEISGPDDSEVDGIVHVILDDSSIDENRNRTMNDSDMEEVNERVYEGQVTRSRGSAPDCDWVIKKIRGAKREEREAEEARHTRDMEAREIARREGNERRQEEKWRRQEGKEMEEVRHALEWELVNTRIQSITQTEVASTKQNPVFNMSEAQRLILRFTEEVPDEFFDQYETVASTMK
ncbi:glutamic acid-rich protein-like [Palaemon carinicauda]|uniref:glutamic acid-rich protein-like n=1 Tax=Palaemon carinicauda TaxID=392227 RepID=UPI0035B5A10D